MRSSELKTKTDTELQFDLRKSRRQLFDLRMKQSVGGDQSPSAVGEARRNIARILTILQERKLGVRGQAPRA